MLDTTLDFVLEEHADARSAAGLAAAPADDAALLDAYSRAITDVVDAVGPTVVRIDVWHGRNAARAGSGSGVIVAPDGFVLTNSHVVGGAARVELMTTEGRELTARVVGDDPDTDLALVRVDAPVTLPAATLGNSKRLRRGQLVVAIGNPLGFEFDRDGGRRLGARPLAARAQRAVDRRRDPDRCGSESGEFRRAACLLAWRGDRREHRASFRARRASASRSPRTLRTLCSANCMRHGRVRRAYIGISAQQITIPRRMQLAAGLAQSSAAAITASEPGSPANRAGLLTGDMIVALDGAPVTGADDLIRLLTGERIGRAIEIGVLRLGKPRAFTLVPEERKRK